MSNEYKATFAEVCVKAVIVNDEGNVFLLHRRKNDIGGGKWDLPGGMLENAETPTAGLSREVKEETSLMVDQWLPIETHGAVPRKIGRYTVWIWFKGISNTNAKIRLDHENSEYAWLDPGKAIEISDDLLPAVHKKAIRSATIKDHQI